ncbi:MAG TPA: hypothetical protein VFP19_09140 [Candidatus Limnocylindrales bacterium]|nr:hypothetical protein [Candidatus Limnocylindrales bacterium]
MSVPRPGRALFSCLVVGALALLVVGCVATPSAVPSTRTFPDLSVSNGTTIAVTILVNDVVLETVKPGGYQDPLSATMPSLPWRIEARSASGRLLASLVVATTTYVDSNTGVGARAELSCGRLDLWSGPPMIGPMPPSPAGTAGDCS